MDDFNPSGKEGLEILHVDAENAAEWIKRSSVSVDQARRSMDRLDTLERNKPTMGQVARYGTIGGLGGAGIGAVGNLIETGAALKGTTPKEKALNLASSAVKGALGGGALPLLRAHSDRRAEMGTLRKFMNQDKTAALGAAPLWRRQAGFTPPGMQTAAQRLQKSMAMGKVDPSKGLKPLNIKVGHTVALIVKQAGLLQRLPQAVRALPGAAKSVALGANEAALHKNEIAGLGVLAIPGLDTLQASARARLAGDKSHGAVEKRQLLGEGTHAALDVGGLGLLAAPAVAHLKHAFANSGYAGNVAQNGPGMKSHSPLAPFRVPPLQVKVSEKSASPLKRIGELVTGSKAGRLREAALRHADRAADGKLPRELKAARKLRGLAKAEEGRVGKVQGALVGSAALGTVSDSTGMAEKIRDRKKEAGVLRRAGELVTGSRLKKLEGAAKQHLDNAIGRAAIADKGGAIASRMARVGAAQHPVGRSMVDHAINHSRAFSDSAQRHLKAGRKASNLASKENAKVTGTRLGLGAAGYIGALSGASAYGKKSIEKLDRGRKKKEAGVGVGAGMTTSQYSGPLSYGPFKMTSGIPPFKRPAMTKRDESLEGAAWMYGENKEASMAATGAMNPAGKLNSSQRVGAPKTTGFSGPSIADIAKPKGFGTPMPGAQKNQI